MIFTMHTIDIDGVWKEIDVLLIAMASQKIPTTPVKKPQQLLPWLSEMLISDNKRNHVTSPFSSSANSTLGEPRRVTKE
jgi:hypothetical protein